MCRVGQVCHHLPTQSLVKKTLKIFGEKNTENTTRRYSLALFSRDLTLLIINIDTHLIN